MNLLVGQRRCVLSEDVENRFSRRCDAAITGAQFIGEFSQGRLNEPVNMVGLGARTAHGVELDAAGPKETESRRKRPRMNERTNKAANVRVMVGPDGKFSG